MVLLAVLTFLLPHSTGSGSHPYWNDAGSGTDAGNATATALGLPDQGTYDGYLLPRDVDWYRLDRAAPEPVCVELLARSDVESVATLQVSDGASVREAQAPVPRGGESRLAFASPSALQTLVGMRIPEASDWKLQGAYGFTLSHLDARSVVGDAGTGQDAGGSLQAALPVGSGCFGGVLAPQMGVGDVRDAFRLDAPASGTLSVSFAYLPLDRSPMLSMGQAPRLDVLDANGTVLATLGQGDVAAVPVQAGSPYYLTTSSQGTTRMAYLVGLNLPDGNPCRPHC